MEDDFFESLSLQSTLSSSTEEETNTPTISLSEHDIQNLALTELIKNVNLNNAVLEEVKDMIIMGAESDFVQSYAGVAKANADALKVLSEMALQKEKLRVQKEVKQMDIDGKKEIEEVKHRLGVDDKRITNNNFLVMSREEVFDRLFNKNKDKDVIETSINES